jgi:hypothetical protein
MADSPPPRLPTTSNAHPAAAEHLGDGVEAAGAAIEAVQPPTTTAEIAPSGGRFGGRFRRTDDGRNTLYIHPHHLQPPHRRRQASKRRDSGGWPAN